MLHARDRHAELPRDFDSGWVAERVSEFYHDRTAAEDDGCDLAALGGFKEESNYQVAGIYTAAQYLLAMSDAGAHLLRAR